MLFGVDKDKQVEDKLNQAAGFDQVGVTDPLLLNADSSKKLVVN